MTPEEAFNKLYEQRGQLFDRVRNIVKEIDADDSIAWNDNEARNPQRTLMVEVRRASLDGEIAGINRGLALIRKCL